MSLPPSNRKFPRRSFAVVLAATSLASVVSASAARIAEIHVALTFARVGAGVVLVTELDGDVVRGLSLTCALGRPVGDPIEVFLEEGYRNLRKLAALAPRDCIIVSKLADLTIPVDLTSHHIAAGTNFPEHAGEAEVEGGPFLFAKLVEPTRFDAPVSVGDGLLDYEVELAWVTLEPLQRGSEPEYLGLLLCNDYTDRATLLRHIDVSDVESGVGFTTGKSFPGYLPVGAFFVIPASYRGFSAAVELRLEVNGEMRQRAKVAEAIWDIDEMIDEVWQWQAKRWEHRGEQVGLLAEQDVIPARTMLLGGTPSGTAFQGISTGTMVAGVGAWLFGGWEQSVADNVVEEYIEDAREEKRFLQPDDRVRMNVDGLGTIENLITE